MYSFANTKKLKGSESMKKVNLKKLIDLKKYSHRMK